MKTTIHSIPYDLPASTVYMVAGSSVGLMLLVTLIALIGLGLPTPRHRENAVSILTIVGITGTILAILLLPIVPTTESGQSYIASKIESTHGATDLLPSGTSIGTCTTGSGEEVADYTWKNRAGNPVTGTVTKSAEADGGCTYQLVRAQ